MIEPVRSQYLAALGIENYVPRFILPAAKPSAACAWLYQPADVSDVSAPIDDAMTEGESAQPAVATRSITEIIQRTPIIDSAIKDLARSNEILDEKKQGVQVQDGPQFALSIVLAAGGLLLIDDAPASNADRTAFQKLLNNMLPALRSEAAQYVLDIFFWPLTRQPKIPRDAAAASETLAAYLHKQIHQKSVNTVLLLGETAQQWCAFTDMDVRVVKSNSLLACVREPALKRPLWNDIRHLAER